MRPYVILMTVALVSAAALAQQPFTHTGNCAYGCAPYIPLLTTPEISYQQFSPNPVGATNATTGLIAGATNATLSEIPGPTSSVYTEPVWNAGGGAPIIAPQVYLSPEPLRHGAHPMREERAREEGRAEVRGGGESRRDERGREEGQREEARAAWSYFPSEHVEAATSTTAGKKANRTYTNDDVTRQNDKNGAVKYAGKTEKL